MGIKILLVIFVFSTVTYAQENYELLFMNGDYVQVYNQSTRLVDSSDYYWNALVSSKNGDVLGAISTLETGLIAYPNDERLEQLVVSCYFETGQYVSAKPILLKYAHKPSMFLHYIKVLEFEEDYILVIERLNERLLSDSLNIAYLKLLGENYYRVDSLEQAIMSFERLLSINSKDQVVAHKLVSLYLKHKNYKNAVAVCDSMLALDSTNRKFIKLRAMGNFNIPDFEAAMVDLRYLLQYGDSSKFVVKHLGVSELSSSLFVEGRSHLLSAFALDSNDFETSFYLGKAYLNSPDPEKGLYYLNHTIELLQPDPKILSAIYIEKQSIYSTILEYEKAVECYEIAYKYTPKPEYLFYIASSYENLIEDKKQAIDYYEKFLNSLPDKPDSDLAENSKKGQITVSLKNLAEQRIVKLKEELFFEGK